MKNVVPATKELLREFYGEERLRTLPTMRAYCFMEDGKPAAVTGFIRLRHNVMALFSDADPELRKRYPLSALKLARMMLKIADDNGWTLISDADPRIPEAAGFLEHLGFEPGENGEYIK